MIRRINRLLIRMVDEQHGQILVIMLIVLALGGIVLAPTLNYTASSLKHQEVIETRALELYSADSGVALALATLSSGNTTVAPYSLNGRTVSVNMTNLGEGNWLITSTASSPDGSSTSIHTGVSSSGGFEFLLDNAITSHGDVTIKGDVTGNVTAGGDVDNKGSVNGTIQDQYDFSSWPSAEYLSDYYANDVDMGNPYPDSSIDVSIDLSNPPWLESLYRNGTLDIYNSDKDLSYAVALNGTIYVTGNMRIGDTNKDFTLDLNGQTIFCESDITVGGSCTIIGSGCIICIGDMYFAPKGEVGSEDDFVFIFSIEGTTQLQPSGEYHGSIAGNVEVIQQPGNDPTITWNTIGTEGGLNFPMEAGVLGGSTEEMVIGGWDIS